MGKAFSDFKPSRKLNVEQIWRLNSAANDTRTRPIMLPRLRSLEKPFNAELELPRGQR